MANSVDIVLPLFQELQSAGIDNVQLFGGIGSAALCRPDLKIFGDTCQIAVGGDLNLPQYRPNGTLRDLDALVLTTDQAKVERVEKIGQQVIGSELDLSFFGLLSSKQLLQQRERPVNSLARRFLADRYVSTDSIGSVTDGYKAVYPFQVPLNLATFETWSLQYRHQSLPIPHPSTSILNYLTRSISGLREKDAEKVKQLSDNIFNKNPEMLEWVVDGPGSSLLRLARILHTLREPKNDPAPLIVGEHLVLQPLSPDELRQAADPMAGHLSPKSQRLILAISRFKARNLHRAESHQEVVAQFQKHIESRVDRIVKNSD